MKTIGLIGGMSWESTIPYYRHINEAVKEKLGGLHSAKILLYSVDFHDIERLQRAGLWAEAGELLANAAATLQVAGADFIVLCTNTMHIVAPAIESKISIPLLHIADPTAEAIKLEGHATVGLLGTRFTMEQPFYKDRLSTRYGLNVVTPTPPDRDIVHKVIYDELCLGKIDAISRSEYRRIIVALKDAGAQAVILGCTEISLLIAQEDSVLPIFDTTRLHAVGAAAHALA